MIIKLQRNSSDENYFYKTITDVFTKTGTLKDQSSIIDPVIMVEGRVSDFADVNYMTIPDFGRSYYIRDITSFRSNLVMIKCHVDVLVSFRDAILSNEAIIAKQENAWNLYLDDGSFKVYNNPIILTKAFPSGFTTQSFILAVAGGAGSETSSDSGGGGGHDF